MKSGLALFLLLAVLAPFVSPAQDSTKVRFFVKGSADFWITIDGELQPLSNVQRIAPGKHAIEIWSPMHLKHKGTIDVPKEDSISFYQELKRDPNYGAYLIEMDKYKRKVFLGRTAPIVVAIAGAVTSPILYFSRKSWHEKTVIEDFKYEYFSGNASGAENTKARYQAANALFFTSLGMIAGGIASYAVLHKWVAKLEKPLYRQENPFTIEAFEIGMNPTHRVPQLGLTLNF